MAGVLDEIRIIDWTQWQMGTVATEMMTELGAEVIHIEARLTGDNGRYLRVSGLPDLPEGKSAYFETNNRGKKSLALDLSKPAGKEIVYRLAKKSDVFVHNFRQGVPEKLGMDYDTILRHNPEYHLRGMLWLRPARPRVKGTRLRYDRAGAVRHCHADRNAGQPQSALARRHR